MFGHGDDKISIKERVMLDGENSRGLLKTRVALEDRAQAEVTGITEGNAALRPCSTAYSARPCCSGIMRLCTCGGS